MVEIAATSNPSFRELLIVLENAHDQEIERLRSEVAVLTKHVEVLSSEKAITPKKCSSEDALTKESAEDESIATSEPPVSDERVRLHFATSGKDASTSDKNAEVLSSAHMAPVRSAEESSPEKVVMAYSRYAMPSKSFSALNALDLTTDSLVPDNENLVAMLCNFSVIAKVAFTLGGFVTFRRVWLQRIYMSAFVFSLFACFVFCAMNWVSQMPPYFTPGAGINTLYFHIVAFHAWYFWRRFVHDPHMRFLVRLFFRMPEARVSQIAHHIRFAFLVLLVAQFLIILLAFVAFCYPPLHWVSTDDGSGASGRLFAIIHGATMIAIIPQHVPTMLVSIALFYVVLQLHNADMERAINVIRQFDIPIVPDEDKGCYSATDCDEIKVSLSGLCPSVALSKMMPKVRDTKRVPKDTPEAQLIHRCIVNTCCDMTDDVQRRLDYTAHEVRAVWAHLVIYSTFQMALTAYQCKMYYLNPSNGSWNRTLFLQFLMDLFHFFIGVMIFFSGLLMPAVTTLNFVKTPRRLLDAMNNRGCTSIASAPSVPFLYSKLVGFTTFYYTQVSMDSVAKYISFVALGSSLYTWSTSWESDSQ